MVLQKHIIKVYLSNLEEINGFKNELGDSKKDNYKRGLQWSPLRLRKDRRTETTEVRGEKAPSMDCEGSLALFPLPAPLFSFVCKGPG